MSRKKNKVPESEVHLFIIWEHARNLENKILKDIATNFKVLKAFEVNWSDDKFAENLSRFYGTQLPPNSRKEVHVGTGTFLAVVVQDKEPIYETHTTSKGDKHVNTKMFTSKSRHREWLGGGHKVHATNTLQESDHNLTLLFGVNTHDFIEKYKSSFNSKRTEWNSDLIGAHGWKDLSELFYVLNNTQSYVVLRNFEPLPDNYYAENHGDIDLLVDNYKDAFLVANAKSVHNSKHRVYSAVKVGDDIVYFDFRYLGDNYYDERWQASILHSRKKTDNSFFAPSDSDYFYSLLYHALIHKPKLGDDYVKRLVQLGKEVNVKLESKDFKSNKAIEVLSRFMTENDFAYTEPQDKSVYYHMKNIQIGVSYGASFKKRRVIPPIRNILKENNIPFKHYLLKIRKLIKRKIRKLKNV